MKYRILALLVFISSLFYANDGAFYARGNQLIPINETQISVKKEILTLKKVNNKYIEVTVYYEFYNPGKEKTITVGFEAIPPLGDVDPNPKNGNHPYMRDFTVELNQQILSYDVAYVQNENYYKNGKINSVKLDDINDIRYELSGEGYMFYVYHFQAHFKKGLNIIKHTYNYDLSGSVDFAYNFEYVLTAANRWANKQIDDFTLIIDNDSFESFNIAKTFFKDKNEWLIHGIGKVKDVSKSNPRMEEEDLLRFHIQKGYLVFQKKNFKPKGELIVFSLLRNFSDDEVREEYLPFSPYDMDYIPKDNISDFKKRVYKNLPYARRGYIFKNKELNDYFQKIEWYIPNPNYIPSEETLTDLEIKWLKMFR